MHNNIMFHALLDTKFLKGEQIKGIETQKAGASSNYYVILLSLDFCGNLSFHSKPVRRKYRRPLISSLTEL